MTITGILIAIVIGAVIGALGRLVLPGRQPIGFLLTIGVGIVAALIGTAIAQQVGVATTDGIDWIELVFQVALAAVGVAAVAAFQRRRHTGRGHH
ncbi:GlsB/YeaQ/YmgE family stress response membrane protein [Actinomadura hibisca]|uniref:GlsB/YeaQ/YmgE family stress response membrane protein n=1 Tax=Actinomadura hibisca TaxID=68565 RepID=UPI0008358914|nr:GlsB/YeaQ/YmgE family stress response membrane protein [Actinomadura hibisca]